jgi:putative transposase
MIMPQVFRYRLKPTKKQVAILNRQLDLCRWTYNQTLALRKNAWEDEEKNIGYYESKRYIKIWKEGTKPELSEVHSHVLQDVSMRVDLAFQAFFRRLRLGEDPGYPRFKGRNWYDSLTYFETGFKLDDDSLWLSKIGDIKVWLHRPIEGIIKRLTIRRTASKKWYVSFLVDDVPRDVLPHLDNAVGIDVGITNFAVFSDGTVIKNEKYLASYEDKLARTQSKKDKMPHKSPERKKAARKLARMYEKVGNLRNDFANQLSRKIVNSYGIICMEDGFSSDLIKNKPYMAKSVLDASWNRFRTFLSYKAASAGRKFVLVNPAYTSQMCSSCGTIVPKDLSERVHNCPKCGLVMDRDLNASKNILRLGLQSVPIRLTARCPRIHSGE